MQTVHLRGTPRSMGEMFGERERSAVHELYRFRLENAVAQAEQYGGQRVTERDILEIARRCLPVVRAFSPGGYDELQGVARGADLSFEKVWAMNALTDLRDVAAYHEAHIWAEDEEAEAEVEGCSSVVVLGDRTDDATPLIAQTWDLATTNMPYVRIVVRTPETGPATVCLTTVGCLSLIGMNEHGIAVGTTNLRAVDARIGVGYLDVIHEALARERIEDSVAVIESAPRAGAHYYTVADAEGSAALIECTARRHSTHRPSAGVHVHTNHFLDDELRCVESRGTPAQSSHRRIADLNALIDRSGRRSVTDVQAALADHGSGDLSICRHDYGGISTNGAVVMKPEVRRLLAVQGPPCRAAWISIGIGSTGPPDADPR